MIVGQSIGARARYKPMALLTALWAGTLEVFRCPLMKATRLSCAFGCYIVISHAGADTQSGSLLDK